jgi:RNA methyltransferase, TrmH family
MVELTSIRNPLLQRVRKAAATGRPTEEGLLVGEGPHLLEEVISGKWRVEQVLATAEAVQKHHHLLSRTKAEVVHVSRQALSAVAETKAPQELVVLLRPPTWAWVDLTSSSALILILDSIQDPGNAGTMVRSAEAFGASGVVFLRGSARVSNGKFMRATAGSIFRLPYLEDVTVEAAKSELAARDVAVFALIAGAPKTLWEADLKRRCALAVGNEGRGLSVGWKSGVQSISVPTNGVESLNAAVACSIVLFETYRQRSRLESL